MRKLSNTPAADRDGACCTRSRTIRKQRVTNSTWTRSTRTFDEIKDQHFDGMIITGAPVELLDFEDVDYWDELLPHHGSGPPRTCIPRSISAGAPRPASTTTTAFRKFELPEEAVRRVRARGGETVQSPLVRGFDDRFRAPHSRYTEVHADDIEAHPSPGTDRHVRRGRGLSSRKAPTADTSSCSATPSTTCETLPLEYERDLGRGLPVSVPAHYFPRRRPRAGAASPPGAPMRSCCTPTG